MLEATIIFLIRKKLGLKQYEHFQFTNQREKSEWYYFGPTRLFKEYTDSEGNVTFIRSSNVSLNWLLDDRCKIIKKEV